MADLSITAANVEVTSNTQTTTGVAGATITAGEVVYKDSSDNDDLKLAVNNSTSAEAAAVGIALHAASDQQPLKYATAGTIKVGAGVGTKGDILTVSSTAGAIHPDGDLASTEFVTIVGSVPNANEIEIAIFASAAQHT